ncbi:Homeobox protein PKNOX1 [Phlyctema vagabunda]|uniref:Homeobox protein PKNOX1 n=1 Tax=Phlyctema vagabunda TaxID=108571 RepID=A0ABR4P7M5_9HELO
MEIRTFQYPSSTATEKSMSTLTMRAHSILPSAREMLWDERRPMDLPSRPRSQVDRVELPSIRQAVPELQLRLGQETPERRADSRAFSPPTASVGATSDYVPSPSLNKRRRLSTDEDAEEIRDYTASRSFRSPSRQMQRPRSGGASPRSNQRVSESWSGSNRSSPYAPPRALPAMRSPQPFESASVARPEWRPTLPSLPSLTLERASPAQPTRGRSNWSEYALDTSRSGVQPYPPGGPSFSPPPPSSYQSPPYAYSGYQPPRNQSYAAPSSHPAPYPHDRTPFSTQAYPPAQNPHDPYMAGYGDMSLSGESKTRKRRGNLPKETTDKLRAWFVAHLQHPYPTEDEKQELMRLTGLQMNQISNWFINARRRQLPTMINNARAESDARTARSGDHASSSRGTDRTSVSLGESEGEYEDEYGSPGSMVEKVVRKSV